MKKLFLLVLTSLTVLSLAACAEEGSNEDGNNEVLEVLDTITLSSEVSEDFTLLVAKDNVVISWESNNTAIAVSGANATVTQGSNDVNVKLTATGTKGEQTATKEYTIKVLKETSNEEDSETPQEPTVAATIAEALTAEVGTSVVLDHVTVLKSYSSGTHFTDGINVIYAYGSKNLTVGDSYSIEAVTAAYAGAPQISSATLTKLDGVQSLTVQPTTATVAEINQVSTGTDYKFYSVTGVYNSSTATLVDGDDTLGINSYSLSTATALLKNYHGLTITLELFVTGGYKDYKEVLIYTTQEDLDKLTFDNSDLLDAALNNVTLPTSTMADLELVTEGNFNSTISWVSSNESVISTTGVVNRQTVDTEVTLTATATIGSDTATKDFVINVISSEQTVSSDLFISEYSDGVGGTNKYVEVYNPGDDIDFSEEKYELKIGINGAAFSTTVTLTGTLESGQTILFYNLQDADLTTAAEAVNSQKFTFAFNGDDAIGLFKNDILVDIIGVEGTDPGSCWEFEGGTTMDCRLIRKAGYGANNTFTGAEWDYVKLTTPGLSDNFGTHTFTLDTTDTVNLLVAVLENKEVQLEV